MLTAGGCYQQYVHLDSGAIQHKLSGLCLQPSKTIVADGTPLVYRNNCTGSAAAFVALSSGALRHVSSKKCLTPVGRAARPADGTAVVLSSCSSAFQSSNGPYPVYGGGEQQRLGRDGGVSQTGGIHLRLRTCPCLSCSASLQGHQDQQVLRSLRF